MQLILARNKNARVIFRSRWTGQLIKTASRIFFVFMGFIVLVLAWNSPIGAPAPSGDIKIISHRGVHQTFSHKGLTNDTCTASRINAPTHPFIENTIASIRAAFLYGADIVEIDVIQTADNDFAVFHDWTVDCRTDGSGETRDYTMAALKTLDIGYGYTADGGETYPFRGKGVGLLPSLSDVLNTFPEKRFQVHVKSANKNGALELHEYLFSHSDINLAQQIALFSPPGFAEQWRKLNTDIKISSKKDVKSCAMNYLLTGWFGRVPAVCQNFGLAAPQDIAWLYWGWPRKTLARFEKSNAKVIVIAPLDQRTGGIDTIDQIGALPANYSGWILTNRIEVIGPVLNADALSPNYLPN